MKKILPWLKIIILALFFSVIAFLLRPDWSFSITKHLDPKYCAPPAICEGVPLIFSIDFKHLLLNYLLRLLILLPLFWLLERKRFLSWRNIILGFLALVAAFLIYVWYLNRSSKINLITEVKTKNSSTQSTQTVNWKTFTTEKTLYASKPDSKYKYTIKYPVDWSVQENGTTTFFMPPEETYVKDKTPTSIYISIRDSRAAVLPVYIKYKTIREVKIENETVKILQAENYSTERYLVEIHRGNFTIEFIFSKDLDSKYDLIFDQILSTFKFLN